MQTWLFVAAGGAIGVCLRFGIAELMAWLLGRHFPMAPWWSTWWAPLSQGWPMPSSAMVTWWNTR